MTKYYVIHTEYVGTSTSPRYWDQDTVVIATSPALTNQSREPRVSGWCGTTNEFCITAHGEFSTIEKAEDYIQKTFGGMREIEKEDDIDFDDSVVKAYKPGQYIPLSPEASKNLCWSAVEEEITATSTDEEIAALVQEWEEEFNAEGYSLNLYSVEEACEAYRSELQEEG